MKRKRLATSVTLAAGCCVARTLKADQLYRQLAGFTGSNGSGPLSGLIQDSSGYLYGTTPYGGASGDGIVYELSGTNDTTLTTLATFNSSNGAKPFGPLVADSNGNLYGTTETGGLYDGGTVFELSGTNHSSFSTLVSFNASTGTNPFAGLTFDSSGNLYGVTNSGGATGNGTVFEVQTGSHTEITIISFNGSNGSNPQGGLVFDSAGNLYGTTTAGGLSVDGTVFKLSGYQHATITNLATFNGSNGNFPAAALTVAADGSLYGTTVLGGLYADGTVFHLYGPTDQTLTTAVTFKGSNGSFPYTTLIPDAAGNLFGTTQNGGTTGGNAGTIFELNGNGYTNLTQLLSYNASGLQPRGALAADASGNLYGTTSGGGINGAGNGTAFEISGTPFLFYQAPIVVSGTTPYQILPGNGRVVSVVALESLTINPGAEIIVDLSANPSGRRIIKDREANLSSGRLNLTNNDADFGDITVASDLNGTNIAAATGAAASGYNQGNWNGSTGLVSSAAAADTTHTTALGVIENNQSGGPLYTSNNQFDGATPGLGDVLVKYTYYGDANLDGQVDGSDYTLIDFGFKAHGLQTGWYFGDFNYDGVVDGSDYSLIDNSFNNQGPNLSTAAIVADPTGLTAGPAAVVPEPAGVTIFFAAIFTSRRRKTTGAIASDSLSSPRRRISSSSFFREWARYG